MLNCEDTTPPGSLEARDDSRDFYKMMSTGSFAQVARILRILSITAGAVVALVLLTPLTVAWGGWLANPWQNGQGDVLIVLGGSAVDDMLGESSYWRSIYAVRFYRAGGVRGIYLTGGPPERPVAESMRLFLIASGVPAPLIHTETASSSTRENALFLAPLLARDPGRYVLLTSDYHMFRARRVFERAGITTHPHPIPDARKRGQTIRGRWAAFYDLVSESSKVAYYFTQGWL